MARYGTLNEMKGFSEGSQPMSIRAWASYLLFAAILVASAVVALCPSDPPVIRG